MKQEQRCLVMYHTILGRNGGKRGECDESGCQRPSMVAHPYLMMMAARLGFQPPLLQLMYPRDCTKSPERVTHSPTP
jgi:hypothetical protein